MSTFTLAISYLITSNLPWFMDLTFQVPMQYCSLQHWILLLSPVISTTLFLLWLHPFILSGVISPLISSSILGTYWPGEFLFQHPIILHFHTVHGVLKARILKWFAIPSPVDDILSNLSTMTRPSWVAPRAWLSFIELDKAVVLVWLDWLVFCEYGSVCLPSDALLQHLPSYLGSSYLEVYKKTPRDLGM